MPKVVSQEQIFNAVTELLIQKGYSGTTTKEIAKLAGINEVTLFRKYGSKAQLVIQALENQNIHVALGEKIQFSGDVEEDIFSIVTEYMSMVREHGELFPIILSEMARHPELKDALQAPFHVMSKIGDLVRLYQNKGVLRKEEPMSFVAGLLGPLIVHSMLKRANPNLPLYTLDLRSHVQHFLHGHLAEGH